MQAGRVSRRAVERWSAGDCTSFGGLIPTTRSSRIVSQFNERYPESPLWRHVCVRRLRVQGLFGPPSGGTACNLFCGRTVAAPPGCLPSPHWQSSHLLLALGTLGSDESGDDLKSCPGHVGSQLPKYQSPRGPGAHQPSTQLLPVRCSKWPKKARELIDRQASPRRQGFVRFADQGSPPWRGPWIPGRRATCTNVVLCGCVMLGSSEPRVESAYAGEGRSQQTSSATKGLPPSGHGISRRFDARPGVESCRTGRREYQYLCCTRRPRARRKHSQEQTPL